MPESKQVTTLEEDIMTSADWSTSPQICIKCIQDDLERALKPILQKLIKLGRGVSFEYQYEYLARFINANHVHQERVFSQNVSKTAIALYELAAKSVGAGRTQSDEVHEFLRKHLEQIANSLEKNASGRRMRNLSKKLRDVYKNRSSAQPSKELNRDIKVDRRAPTLSQIAENPKRFRSHLWAHGSHLRG